MDLLARVARTGKGEVYENLYYNDGRLSGAFAGRVEKFAEDAVAVWYENVTQRRAIEAHAERAELLARESQQRAELLAQLEEAHMKAQETLETHRRW